MTVKHTPEPWVIDEREELSTNFYSDDVTGSVIGGCPAYNLAPRPLAERQANARRIVACVNACRGLPTDELEQKGLVAAVGTQLLAADDRAEGQEREIRRLVSIAADAENQLADALNQRDELLSLAERLVQWDIDYPVDCDNGYAGLKALDELIRDNKAAIVKIKGEHSQQPNALLDDVFVAGGAA